MTVVVVMGVSGSGKTTIAAGLARDAGWTLLEGDSFHPPANVAKMHAGTPLTDDDRWPWLHAIAAAIDQVRARGGSAVVACSALKRAYRDILVHGRDDVRIIYLAGSQDLIAQRLALSDDQKAKATPVFEDVAQKQAAVRADTSLDPVAKRAKIKEIQADANNQLKEILTPEQFDKWQKMQPMRRPAPRPPAAAPGTTAPTPPQ